MPLQPQDLIRTVKRLEITTRRAVDERLAGQYHSVFKGRGMAFDEVRPYQPGDDVRAIDWNVSARMNDAYVKVFSEERELTVMILVDLSASIGFGSQKKSKAEVAAELTALLALSAVKNNDRVGLVLFTDRVERLVPPKRGRKHALRIVSQILLHRPAHQATALEPPLTTLRRSLHRRAISFLISDFLAPVESYQTALTLSTRRHDVVPIVLRDPLEAELPNVGLLAVQDPETGELGYVDTRQRAVREAYQKELQRRDQARDRLFGRLGLDQVQLRAGEDYVKSLVTFFLRRERRRTA
jgi:uncharacterized protein (DUF58 family)